MGHKGVSKRKPKAQKQKTQDAATTSTTSGVAAISKETDLQVGRAVARGQAITSGKSGKEKHSGTKSNKKK